MGDVADCAAIELDIENITGVTDADDHFIRSAQKFVVSSIPRDLLLFALKQSSTYTGGGGVVANIDGIVEVQRNGYSCKQISIQESKWASDSTSLKYATSKHPVWWFDSNVVKILPEPSGSEDGYYYYIDYTEINDDSDLRNAVVYRACSNEFSKLATSKVSSLSISAVPPDVPSLSSITFNSIDIAQDSTLVAVAAGGTLGSSTSPTFTAPTVGGVTEELTAALTALTGDALANDADFLDVSKWFTAVGEMIEDEEDLELASAQLQKISTYINAYQAQMQSNLHEFNEANVKFQASVQESLAEFQSANQMAIANAERSQQRQLQNSASDMKVIYDNNAQKISKYQSELQQYQSEVSSEVQEYQQNLADRQYYFTQAEKYYTWSNNEVSQYIKNNVKTINKSIAAQSIQQSAQQRR